MTDPRFHPADPDGVLHDRIQFAAWAGLLQWLSGQAEALQAFTAATGMHLHTARPGTALDRMIDEATGYDPDGHAQRCFAAFVRWATREHWGESEITPSIQAALDRLPAETTT